MRHFAATFRNCVDTRGRRGLAWKRTATIRASKPAKAIRSRSAARYAARIRFGASSFSLDGARAYAAGLALAQSAIGLREEEHHHEEGIAIRSDPVPRRYGRHQDRAAGRKGGALIAIGRVAAFCRQPARASARR